MEFNFDSNPSDDDDIDLDEFDDTGLLALSSRQEASATVSIPADDIVLTSDSAAKGDADDGSIDWEDGESTVDWEDADENVVGAVSIDEHEDLDRKMPALPTQGVTVTFSSTSNTPSDEPADSETKRNGDSLGHNVETAKSRKKRKRVHVLKDVPHHTQQLILGVRRSHMLCCVARSVKCSSICSTTDVNIQNKEEPFNTDDGESRDMLLSLAYSLIPSQFHTSSDTTAQNVPTNQELQEFARWFFDFISAGKRRRETIQQNIARGAAASSAGSRRRNHSSATASTRSTKKGRGLAEENDSTDSNLRTTQYIDSKTDNNALLSTDNLITKLMYLSPYYDDDPQLFINDGIDCIGLVENITPLEKVLLFLSMVRSLGWRARLVSALDPLPLQLTVDHPLLQTIGYAMSSIASMPLSWFSSMMQNLISLMKEGGVLKQTSSGVIRSSSNAKQRSNEAKQNSKGKTLSHQALQIESSMLHWVEVLCSDSDGKLKQSKPMYQKQATKKWIAVFPDEHSFDAPLDAEVFLAKIASDSNETKSVTSYAKPSNYKRGKTQTRKTVKKKPVSYVLAIEHFRSPNTKSSVRLTDVTPRYASTWSLTLRLRGATGKDIAQGGGKCVDEWWDNSLKVMNRQYRNIFSSSNRIKKMPSVKSTTPVSISKSKTSDGKEVEVLEIASDSDEEKPDSAHSDESENELESKELSACISKEPIPTSKTAFKHHPQYVIQSVLNSSEVLHPDARKHICGVFKGQIVYRREDVSKALKAKQWLYQGRKVKEKELNNPVKKVKPKKKRSKGFKVLKSYVDSNKEALPVKYSDDDDESEMDRLYGIWQTKPWTPQRVGPNETIPVNEYNNIELALINPGLAHMEQPRLSVVAKRLGVPYAPCMCGYEGNKGNQTPTIRGIVVHDHNVELLSEAYIEYQSQLVETEVEARRQNILKKWKRLVVGILTKDRLDKAYS